MPLNAAQQNFMGELTRAIAAAATAQPTDLALDVMRLSIVDWMACGIAGASEPAALKVRSLIEAEAGTPQATLFGGGRAPARAAALFNGTASHALDYDDTHFAHIGHVSVGVVPAALAIAELEGTTIDGFTRAALAGCEAAIRMGLQLGRPHYQIGFHQTATAGAFGATLAAVLQITPDDTVMAHALGLCSTRASGLKSQFGTDGKPFNAGMAASNGVEAALLASRGFISDPDGWDAPHGYIATHHGAAVDVVTDFLMPEVSHKYHACCHGLHAALEAFATLQPVDPVLIDSITVHTAPRWIGVCDKPAPRTGLEAKFSFACVLAFAAFGYDTARLETFSDALVRKANIIALRDKVRVHSDPSLGETAAKVIVQIGSTTRVADFELNKPAELADRQMRMRAKAAALVGDARAAQIWDVVHGDQSAPISRLSDVMKA